jgi:hypothetical protein
VAHAKQVPQLVQEAGGLVQTAMKEGNPFGPASRGR